MVFIKVPVASCIAVHKKKMADAVRALLIRAYGWEPATLIRPPPHAIFLGGVDPITETPFDVVAHERRGIAREPTLIISFGDPAHIEIMKYGASVWQRSHDVEWLTYSVYDHPSYTDAFRIAILDAVQAIERHERERKESCIFVHCYMGISRSASALILYLMRNTDMSLRNALEFLRWCRPCVNPNIGFLHELTTLEDLIQR